MASGTTTIVDLLRHGEPVGGRAIRGNGCDDPLSDKGWEQMRSAVPATVPWQAIVTSPMRRCRNFAEELATAHGLPHRIEDDLREVGFGDWEGHTHEELQAADAESYRAFYRDPVNCRPPGAEPLDEFVARAGAAFDRVLAEAAAQHILVICHAGVIRAVLAHVLELPLASMYRVKIDNAAYTRFGSKGDSLELLSLNARVEN